MSPIVPKGLKSYASMIGPTCANDLAGHRFVKQPALLRMRAQIAEQTTLR